MKKTILNIKWWWCIYLMANAIVLKIEEKGPNSQTIIKKNYQYIIVNDF